jgi:hypothetical protein
MNRETSMVFVTQANVASMIYWVDRVHLLNLSGEVYKRPIYILSTGEKRRLLAIRRFFEASDVFIEQYFGKARGTDDECMVFEGTSPAYHTIAECERLNSDYTNYEIPEQIMDMAKTDPSLKARFRQWFKDNSYLLDDNNPKYQPGYFLLRIRADFKVDIRDIREVVRPNSGISRAKNASLEEIQKEIDEILSAAGKWFYATEKNAEILRAFQRKTYLAYRPDPLPENITGCSDSDVKAFLQDYDRRFKKPLKEKLIFYYRIRYNPDLSFEGKLLDQVGFLPCRHCHRIDGHFTSTLIA